MDSTIKERISKAIEYLCAHRTEIRTKTDIAKAMHVDRSTVSCAIGDGGNRPVSKVFIKTFVRTFPEISEDYLVNGTGEMVKPIKEEKEPERKDSMSFFAMMFAEQQKTQNLILELIKSQKEELDSMRVTINTLLSNSVKRKDKDELLSNEKRNAIKPELA